MKTFLMILLSLLLFFAPINQAKAAVTTDSNSDLLVGDPCAYHSIDSSDPLYPSYAEHPFSNPETIASENGLLETTLDVKYGDNQIAGCNVHLRSYNGRLVGPTLRVKPGDTIRIKLINDLPPQESPHGEKIAVQTTPEGCAYEQETTVSNQPHDFNVTNFHTHGLHVDPNACSDNVLRTMKPKAKEGDPAPDYLIEVKIPSDHPAGTFWYHAHLHGSTALQVSSGMAGALIVEGGQDQIPEIAQTSEKIFVLQQIAYDQKGQIENYKELAPGQWQKSKRSITINGQVVPIIKMRPGEIQRWRFIHAGVRETILLKLTNTYNNRQIALNEIAVDGIPLGKLDSWTDSIELDPGYRSDILVKAQPLARNQSSQEYYLYDQESTPQKSLLGVGETGSILAKVIVTGQPIGMLLPTDEQLAKVKQKDAPPDILDSEITGPPQEVVFSVNDLGNNQFTFTVNGESFDPQKARILTLNKAEKWDLSTDPKSLAPSHPFHIHVNPFQVDRQGPDRKPERIWKDTLLIRQKEPQTVRSRYTVFTGKFVLHCHILDHEDQGMMEVVQINPNK